MAVAFQNRSQDRIFQSTRMLPCLSSDVAQRHIHPGRHSATTARPVPSSATYHDSEDVAGITQRDRAAVEMIPAFEIQSRKIILRPR